MLHTLKAFWKRPTTIIGLVTAVMFQIIFAIVWMTAYDGATEADRLKQLKVGIVVSDQTAGREIADKLAKELPVGTRLVASGAEAEQLLNERKLQMVITIPGNFSDSLKEPQRAAVIRYSINESNPAADGQSDEFDRREDDCHSQQGSGRAGAQSRICSRESAGSGS
ncbi:ABC transporter permease [Paenibacillus donghaensis]|uniref:YhgE/Pip domain-containing protein n=1 Tax=Paenibacillus donghaensis TaxID=414771 RepID=UPI001D162F65|nr:ABC transporter permease [Paenibacillus donghaensis]MBE9913079.1 ABC transporter permease [Paenibacillus donghaensis]